MKECVVCEIIAEELFGAGICEGCVKEAASDFVYKSSKIYDWRFASESQIAEQSKRWAEFESKRKKIIPQKMRLKVFARDGNQCLSCGSKTGLTCDHVIPESRGGATEIQNLQTLCKPCNSAKGVSIIDYRWKITDKNFPLAVDTFVL